MNTQSRLPCYLPCYLPSYLPRRLSIHVTRRIGFTLIELLVVISIIAILAAMIMPVIAMVRESAAQTTCASLLRSMAMANLAYAIDNDGWYINVRNADPDSRSWPYNTSLREQLEIPNVVPGFPQTYQWPKSLLCRKANTALASGNRIDLTYGLNRDKLTVSTTADWSLHQSQLISPFSEKLMWADAMDWQINKTNSLLYLSLGETYSIRTVAYRHRNRMNLSYFDGHAGSLPSTAVAANLTLWDLK